MIMHALESEASPNRPPRWLKAARILWVVYAVGLLLLYLISLPGYVERVSTGTVPGISFDIDRPPGNAYFTTRVAASGLSVESWLAANTVEPLVVSNNVWKH